MGWYKDNYPDGISNIFWDDFVAPTIKRIKGNKCEECATTKNLDLHHLDYEKEVSIKTLKLLCRSCHKKHHRHHNQHKR